MLNSVRINNLPSSSAIAGRWSRLLWVTLSFVLWSGYTGAEEMSVLSEPAGAELTLDGQAMGQTPWNGDFAVVASVVEVSLSKPGYKSVKQIVRVSPSTRSFNYILEPNHGGYILMAPEGTRVDLKTSDEQIVSLGRVPATGRMAEAELRPAGSYSLLMSREGYDNMEVPFELVEGEMNPLILRPDGWEAMKAELYVIADRLLPDFLLVNGVETKIDGATSTVRVPGDEELTLILEVPGFKPVERQLSAVTPGGFGDVDFGELEKYSGGLRLVVKSPDGAPLSSQEMARVRVLLDREEVRVAADGSVSDLSIGERTLEVIHPDYSRVSNQFTLEDGQIAEVEVKLQGLEATLVYELKIDDFPSDLSSSAPNESQLDISISPDPLAWDKNSREIKISARQGYRITATLPNYRPLVINLPPQQDGARLPLQLSLRIDQEELAELRDQISFEKRERQIVAHLEESIQAVLNAKGGSLSATDKKNADQLLTALSTRYPTVVERSSKVQSLMGRFRQLVHR